MRRLLPILLAATALAQSAPQTRLSHTTEALRGVSAVSRQIAWASGTHGTYLRTTDGRLWIPDQVPGAESLDFRAVVAFSADEAFLMSAGPGDQSRIYQTADRGRHWQLQFTNTNPKGFFDSMVFWDPTHGIEESFGIGVGELELPVTAAVGGLVDAGLVAGAGGH